MEGDTNRGHYEWKALTEGQQADQGTKKGTKGRAEGAKGRKKEPRATKKNPKDTKRGAKGNQKRLPNPPENLGGLGGEGGRKKGVKI